MITIETAQPRTTLPIQITVTSKEVGHLLVVPRDVESGNAIELPLKISGDTKRAEFWTEREGSYDILYISSTGKESVPLAIAKQIYLPFSLEFGMFFALWVGVMIGIIFWVRRIRCMEMKKSR